MSVRAIDHFNAEDYRAALLAFEERWHTERSDFLRALIQLSNAMNQLRLGLVSGPQRNLTSAYALLEDYLPQHEGMDIAAVRDYIAQLLELIPENTAQGDVVWATVPRLCLSVGTQTSQGEL
ncbi:MAG: hypothetical protein GFH27_549279n433 [Chloroflexi bacterium AL-W]|nr:hypothetical protein [Chloroflexi bacterium AL-N1]NOK65399.1 hypothetical protein [Chloroflexi bacterium AL-N10]NOK72335.1 hypothetical protein [Chloroflexi bacterium AL-N5]NOK79578.1 hypothetical protein [Chloroflexi bacterium AL-W]NOK87494.1 hypothetical protein [Chloroflexi bacterium AL-N15]